MWLRKLVLNNFQKHAHLELEFQNGVNYIYGSSDAGKSCIRRAIGFLFFGDPRTDSIRKEGTKQTSVLGVLDNGIEVERIKSATVNRYIIRKEGKEVVYDSIGASIPEEVQAVLQVSTIDIDKDPLNLNVAEQISLPFLLDKPGSFRLKLFNKLTGNDLLDKLVQNLNKEMLQIGRDIKSEQDFVATNEPKLAEVTIQVTEKQKLLGNYKELKIALDEKLSRYKKLVDLHLKLETINTTLKQTEEALKVIKIVPDETINRLHEMIDKWISLSDLKEALEEDDKIVSETETQLKEIKIADIDTSAIKEKISRLDALKKASELLQDALRRVKTAETDIQAYEGKIAEFEAKYQSLLKEAGVCPVCKQDTSKCGVAHG
jgi:DNA repair ATPase RecN